jgi:hypothetical protein
MTKADWAERTNPEFEWKIQKHILLWQQWRLEIHDRTPIVWQFLMDELAPFGFTDPQEQPTAATEATTMALAALVNMFYARYSLPEIPGCLELFLNDLDEAAAEFEEDGIVPTRPDPEPDDWYLHIAEAMGLTQHEDWAEIDATIRMIANVGCDVIERVRYFDYADDIILAKILCAMSDFGRMDFTQERGVLDGRVKMKPGWYLKNGGT